MGSILFFIHLSSPRDFIITVLAIQVYSTGLFTLLWRVERIW